MCYCTQLAQQPAGHDGVLVLAEQLLDGFDLLDQPIGRSSPHQRRSGCRGRCGWPCRVRAGSGAWHRRLQRSPPEPGRSTPSPVTTALRQAVAAADGRLGWAEQDLATKVALGTLLGLGGG